MRKYFFLNSVLSKEILNVGYRAKSECVAALVPVFIEMTNAL